MSVVILIGRKRSLAPKEQPSLGKYTMGIPLSYVDSHNEISFFYSNYSGHRHDYMCEKCLLCMSLKSFVAQVQTDAKFSQLSKSCFLFCFLGHKPM